MFMYSIAYIFSFNNINKMVKFSLYSKKSEKLNFALAHFIEHLTTRFCRMSKQENIPNTRYTRTLAIC